MNFNNEERPKPKKTKNLSPLQYIEVLEKEYMGFEIRSKIYSSKKSKDSYEEIAEYKRSQIERLSKANDLPTMFSDYERYIEVKRNFLGKCGIPNFIYNDENIKERFFQRDLEAYFATGSEVKVFDDVDSEEFIKAEIISYDYSNETVTVLYEGLDTEEIKTHEGLVRRIM